MLNSADDGEASAVVRGPMVPPISDYMSTTIETVCLFPGWVSTLCVSRVSKRPLQGPAILRPAEAGQERDCSTEIVIIK